jgi:predicted nucleotidyltransferase
MHERMIEAERFTEELAGDLGARLRSVVLHGSVARDEAVPEVSDVNLLVLVDTVDPGLLRQLAPHARRWLDKERALPLVLTWDEWRSASDAFAIETADMIDARTVLHGEDPLDDATVHDRHLRVQAERELRGKLIHLREGTLATANRPRELGRLILTALPSVATYLRAVLRLVGQDVAHADTPDVIRRGCAVVDSDPELLLELWEARARRKTPKVEVEDPRVTAVHEALESTAHYVDSLSGERAQ